MVSIMADLATVESILADQHEGNRDLRLLSYEYYDEVLKNHKVSKTDFETTLEAYMDNHDDVDHFFEDVITEITRRKEAVKEK